MIDTALASASVNVLRARVDDGIAMSFGALRERSLVLVELRNHHGTIGRGESWVNFPPWAPVERAATLTDGVLPLLIKGDAGHVREIHATLQSKLGPLGRQWGAPGPIAQAISSVDLALWDLLGRVTGVSVSTLLGTRVRDEIPIYASSLGPSDVESQALLCRENKHTAVKIKVGFGRELDADNLSKARNTLGSDIALYADANQAWTVDQALSMSSLLEKFDIHLLEEPLAGDRLEDLEYLHEKTGLNIATGENLYGLETFRKYIESPAVQVIQPDICKAGGLTEVQRIADYANKCETAVMPHVYSGAVAFSAALQLAACAPSVTAIEYDIRHNPLRDGLLTNAPRPRLGRIPLPSGPGLGTELDTAAMRKYLTTSNTIDLS